jgi:hypothetical protein
MGSYVETVVGSADGVTEIWADLQTSWTATDPHASGTATFGVNRLDQFGATVLAGTFSLENEDGSWEGTFNGYRQIALDGTVWALAGPGDWSNPIETHAIRPEVAMAR